MPKTREQKRDILHGIKDKLGRAKAVVFAKFGPLTVKESEELRNNLRKESGEILVAKKTLLEIAFKDAGLEADIRQMDGRVAAVFGYGDEVSPARIVSDFRKGKEEKIDFLGGVLENKFIDAAAVKSLSAIPGRTELYAKLVGSLNAPISGFVHVLSGNLRGLVNVLNSIKDKKSA